MTLKNALRSIINIAKIVFAFKYINKLYPINNWNIFELMTYKHVKVEQWKVRNRDLKKLRKSELAIYVEKNCYGKTTALREKKAARRLKNCINSYSSSKYKLCKAKIILHDKTVKEEKVKVILLRMDIYARACMKRENEIESDFLYRWITRNE